MLLSFTCALAAALAFGLAALLQEDGARRSPERRDVGLRLLRDLLCQRAFVAGIALDAAGFVLTFVALRNLPLFAVEATVSSAVAVTAIGSVRRGVSLSRAGWAAVAAVVVGLALIGSSALPEAPPTLSGAGRLALVGGVPALAAIGFAAGRRLQGSTAAWALGALAGVGFALFGVAGRVLPHAPYLQDPVAWAALAYIGLGLLLYGAALQRGAVTGVMAATTAVETILPALVGLALADGARTGLGAVAAAGFMMTTIATLVLVRCSRTSVPGRPDLGPDFGPDLPVPAVFSSSLPVAPPLLPS